MRAWQAPHATRQVRSTGAASKAHILVVDDDDIAAELAAGMLRAAGHVCGWTIDASEARRMLEWRRPDLLLLGEDVPGLHGPSFLDEVRGSPACLALPVILLAAPGSSTPGAIAKPLEQDRLEKLVAQALPAPAPALAEFRLDTGGGAPPSVVYL